MAAPASTEEIRDVLMRAIRTIAPHWLAQDQEDLAQSAVIRVMHAVEGEESGVRSASYLWKVAHSVVMDELRRRRRRPETSLEEESDSAGTTEPADSPPSRAEGGEIRRLVHDGLKTLNESRRLAVLLFLYGYTLKESASLLGWTTKQVDNQRYRGLAELRSYLGERGYEP
jgi:RNA polymerase sigma-70 factor (ECF subfamily)